MINQWQFFDLVRECRGIKPTLNIKRRFLENKFKEMGFPINEGYEVVSYYYNELYNGWHGGESLYQKYPAHMTVYKRQKGDIKSNIEPIESKDIIKTLETNDIWLLVNEGTLTVPSPYLKIDYYDFIELKELFCYDFKPAPEPAPQQETKVTFESFFIEPKYVELFFEALRVNNRLTTSNLLIPFTSPIKKVEIVALIEAAHKQGYIKEVIPSNRKIFDAKLTGEEAVDDGNIRRVNISKPKVENYCRILPPINKK